jgi:acylphosphatase
MSIEGFTQKGFRITGRVQGVFFRVWTQEIAEGLGLGGTVRNRTDGSVEAHVGGPGGKVDAFEARLWEGPPSSAVEGVEVLESNAPIHEGLFQILPTA